jgi:hypothetical protein
MARLSEVISLWQRGYAVPFGEEMINTLGFRGVAQAGKDLEASSQTVMRLFGDRDGQLLIGMAALWNGCTFCSVGHVHAANLYHLRDHGELFPLDEREVLPLQRLRDVEVMRRLREKFAAPAFARTLALLVRQQELKTGTAADTTPDDEGLRLALAAWDWLNECTITTEVVDVPPLCNLARDRQLRARYQAARARSAEVAA